MFPFKEVELKLIAVVKYGVTVFDVLFFWTSSCKDGDMPDYYQTHLVHHAWLLTVPTITQKFHQTLIFTIYFISYLIQCLFNIVNFSHYRLQG